MAKRAKRAKTAVPRKAKMPPPPGGAAGKLKDVTGKMLEVRKEQETGLLALLREIEEITRDTMNIENEIRRQNLLKGTLGAGQRSLQKELQDLARQNRADENRKKEAEKERQKLLEQGAALKSQVTSLEDDIRKLERENSAMAVEVEKLQAAKEKLKADVERLSALREEYLKNIAEIKQSRDELLP